MMKQIHLIRLCFYEAIKMIIVDMNTYYFSTLQLTKAKVKEVTEKVKRLKSEHYISGDYELYS